MLLQGACARFQVNSVGHRDYRLGLQVEKGIFNPANLQACIPVTNSVLNISQYLVVPDSKPLRTSSTLPAGEVIDFIIAALQKIDLVYKYLFLTNTFDYQVNILFEVILFSNFKYRRFF